MKMMRLEWIILPRNREGFVQIDSFSQCSDLSTVVCDSRYCATDRWWPIYVDSTKGPARYERQQLNLLWSWRQMKRVWSLQANAQKPKTVTTFVWNTSRAKTSNKRDTHRVEYQARIHRGIKLKFEDWKKKLNAATCLICPWRETLFDAFITTTNGAEE